MKFRLGLLFTLSFVLSACSGNSSFHVMPSTKSVVSTDKTINKVIQPVNPKSSPIRLGDLSVDERDAKLENDELGQITFSGRINLKNTSGTSVHSRNVVLRGVWLSGVDHPVLESEDEKEGEPQVKARLTCLSSNSGNAGCGEVLIDIFMKVPGSQEIHATQLQTVVTGQKILPPKADAATTEPEEDFVAPSFESPEENEEPAKPAPKPEEQKPEVVTPKKEQAKPTPPKTPSTPAPAPQPTPKPLPVPSTPAPAKDTLKPPAIIEELPVDNDTEEDSEGIDSQEKPSIYVGTIFQGADELFKPRVVTTPQPPKRPTPAPAPAPAPAPMPAPVVTPPAKKDPKKEEPVVQKPPAPPAPAPAPSPKPPEKKTPPAPVAAPDKSTSRPKDQAVGLAYAGTLEDANSMKNMSGGFRLLAASRERFFGTYELVRMVNALGNFMTSQRLGPLGVGDLSQEEGGKLRNSRHRSHQNGLDADLAYPVDEQLREKGFVALVSGGEVDSRLRVNDTWRLFKYIWSFNELETNRTTKMDRIFVDRHIKQALCSAAAKDLRGPKGDSFSELLRRIRPEAGHHNHFHLRIQCSPFQPRCRMMGDPPYGSGC